MNSEEGGSKLLNLIGILKLATIVVGVVDLGLVADSYIHWSDAQKYFLAIIIIALILSLFFVVAIVAGLIPVTDLWKKIDMGFHVVIAVLLLIGVLAFMIRLTKSAKGAPGNWKAKQAFSLIFGFINAGLYGSIGVAIFKAL